MIGKEKFKKSLNKFYTKNSIYNLYKEYFINWIADGYIGKELGILEISTISMETKKEFFINLLEEALWEKETFQKVFQSLPKDIREIFKKIVWEGEYSIPEEEIEKYFCKVSENYYTDLNKEYDFFKYRQGNFNKRYLYIDYDIVRVIRLHMDIGEENFNLTSGSSKIDNIKDLYRDNNGDEFLNNMQLYLEFFNSGAIRMSSSGKILKESKRNMMKHCNITEYFTLKGLDDLKTETISLFFIGMANELKNKEYFNSSNIKKIVLDFIEGKIFDKEKPYVYTSLFLNHLKGIKNIWQNSEKFNEAAKSLFKLLKEIKSDEYVNVDDIVKTFIYRDNNIEIVKFEDVKDYIYINEANYERKKINTYKEYFEYIIEPFVKTFITLLSIFGVFEIFYSKPSDSETLYLKSGYLSKYSGVKYIKLTELGKYIFGVIDKYEIPKSYVKSDIQLDDKRFIVTIIGESPTRRMFFEKVGTKIGSNLYKVTKDSFKKGINSYDELKKRIEKFNSITNEKDLPQNWQEFFKELEVKFDSIKVQRNYVVLKLENNKDLIQLVSKDNRFKELTLKAEKYHLLVEEEKINELLKLFNEYGYHFNID